MLLPSDAAVESVVSWLQSAGVSDIAQDADWIDFTTTVGVANELLDTQFEWYMEKQTRGRHMRTLHYSVPDDVAAYIHMIQPTTRFGSLTGMRATYLTRDKERAALNDGVPEASCDTAVTPTCLRTMYGTVSYTADADSGSKVAVGSFLKEYASYEDLKLFEQNVAPWAIGQNFTVIEINGGKNVQRNNTDDTSEANLDVQTVVGLASPLPITEFSTGGLAPNVSESMNEPYLEFLRAILKLPQEQLPQVLSISYGERETSVPDKYAYSVCDLFKQLGSRGTSVIFSSGDGGSEQECGNPTERLVSTFPASCPWVTAVGATQGINETAASFSSGGFSNLWARPAYQNDAIKAYLATGLADRWTGLFNESGRAIPDVSAQGVNLVIYNKGQATKEGGTSASTPAFAGVVGLLNDARLRANKPPLGFLNPWIYSQGYKGLNDVTTGAGTCYGSTNSTLIAQSAHWNASVGWDPVTGHGTPDFPKLKDLVLA